MLVYKFGGASVSTIVNIKNAGEILRTQPNNHPVLTVVSAIGKTTNALENVAHAYYSQDIQQALDYFEIIKQQHLNIAKDLLTNELINCQNQLLDFFTEVEWLLHDKPVRHFDYYYDQIVCIGELLSTSIFSHYLTEAGIENTWVDVRDILRTNDNFREAVLDWDYSAQQVEQQILPLFQDSKIVVTQGFIGSTTDNESTTFGREGSDYTGAIFANLLNAESLTIWKDVPSVMNADPKQFDFATPLPVLSYDEVIEMAFYGAQIIHPKTIKPIHDKEIPLLVKCFLDPALPGTVISKIKTKIDTPVVILKENQALIKFQSKTYDFVGEQAVSELYLLMKKLFIKPNMTQIGAINFTGVYDHISDKVQQLALEAENLFDVQITQGLQMLTIRHYQPQIIDTLTSGKQILLTQKTNETIQFLMQ
ncbi:aspartate kinase [Polluticaenibacter yanchengensis]|uniref:Aspartokinase n=1 Tax=Polluticaenibacter yanchengensis TaxID=3014562 RepID=A0ABT4UGQ5_9BACT|nr:aspartate kinase [Chitinophagaceae bacterium LY-5]